jgi:undecaprenyl-diphosphatase
MDEILFTAANHVVSYSWQVFFFALDSAEASWLLAAVAFVAMWFAGKPTTQNAYIQNLGKEKKDQTLVRSHVMLLFFAMPIAFVLARALQHFFPRQRPMAIAPMEIPIEPAVWDTIKASISTQGSFPSDHAVMWFVMATSILWLSRPAGIIAIVLAIIASVFRIGTGFHWPSDIAGGAVLGVSITIVAFWAFRKIKPLKSLMHYIVGLFDRNPVFMHTLGFLILLDFSRKFAGLFGFLATVFGKSVSH